MLLANCVAAYYHTHIQLISLCEVWGVMQVHVYRRVILDHSRTPLRTDFCRAIHCSVVHVVLRLHVVRLSACH